MGSEMCIRDRPSREQLRHETLGALIPLAQVADVEAFPVLQSQACLLYTSDAADERSSVDLGGRRIIKTKKFCVHLLFTNIYDNTH